MLLLKFRNSMGNRGVAAFGDAIIDFDRMELRCGTKIIPATCLEFRLLRFLVEHPGEVFSREELIAAVWRTRKRANGRSVDNYFSHLRHKLEKDPKKPVHFLTVRGFGYRFVPTGGLLTHPDGPAHSTAVP
jgi:DNA-binding response OmpR family regulator